MSSTKQCYQINEDPFADLCRRSGGCCQGTKLCFNGNNFDCQKECNATFVDVKPDCINYPPPDACCLSENICGTRGCGVSPSPTPPPPTPPSNGGGRILGLCYDTGYFTDYTPSIVDSCVRSDLQQMKDAGYNSFRTYFPVYGYHNGSFAKLASELGMTVCLGVQTELYSTYKNQIVSQIRNYPHAISAVAIGNETPWNSTEMGGNAILSHAQDLRKSIGGNSVKIGTVQQSGFGMCAFGGICTPYCPQGCIDLYERMAVELDFVGFNVYPSNPVGSRDIGTDDPVFNRNSINYQLNKLYDTVPKGKLLIGECGIPWKGGCSGKYQYSRSVQSQLVSDIKEWSRNHSSVPVYIFMAFDVSSKTETPGCEYLSGEKTFGVMSGQTCKRQKKRNRLNGIGEERDIKLI